MPVSFDVGATEVVAPAAEATRGASLRCTAFVRKTDVLAIEQESEGENASPCQVKDESPASTAAGTEDSPGEVIGSAASPAQTAGSAADQAAWPSASDEAPPLQVSEPMRNEAAIVQGLIRGRALWERPSTTEGRCLKVRRFFLDLWFYMKQTHPVLGIFACHTMHPYTTWERAVVYSAACLGSFGVVICFMDPLTGEEPEETLTSMAWYSAGLTSGIVSVSTKMAVLCLTCSCFQVGSCFDCIGLRCIAETVGRCLAIMCMFMAAIMCAIGVAIGKVRGVHFGHAVGFWLLAVLLNLKWSFLWEFITFSWAYFRETTGHYSLSKYPYGPEYPKNASMLWGGDRWSCHRLAKVTAEEPGDVEQPAELVSELAAEFHRTAVLPFSTEPGDAEQPAELAAEF